LLKTSSLLFRLPIKIALYSTPGLAASHLSLMAESDPAMAAIGHPTHRHVCAVGPRPVANGRH
jgi:hypothetical protein